MLMFHVIFSQDARSFSCCIVTWKDVSSLQYNEGKKTLLVVVLVGGGGGHCSCHLIRALSLKCTQVHIQSHTH